MTGKELRTSHSQKQFISAHELLPPRQFERQERKTSQDIEEIPEDIRENLPSMVLINIHAADKRPLKKDPSKASSIAFFDDISSVE